jgi:hypothetical protein
MQHRQHWQQRDCVGMSFRAFNHFGSLIVREHMPRKISRWIQLDGLRHLRWLTLMRDGIDCQDQPIMQPQDLNTEILVEDGAYEDECGLKELIELGSVVELTRYSCNSSTNKRSSWSN